MNDLTELAAIYGTNKGFPREGKTWHHYTGAYHSLLSPVRDKIEVVVEVGVHRGASLRMWRDYFPNAKVWGVDNGSGCPIEEIKAMAVSCSDVPLCEEIRVNLVFGEQANEEVLAKLPTRIDLVVDDGSHAPNDFLATLKVLFPRTNLMYIIEDVFPEFMKQTVKVVEEISGGAWVMLRQKGTASLAVILFKGGA